jgi:hypothetical protein
MRVNPRGVKVYIAPLAVAVAAALGVVLVGGGSSVPAGATFHADHVTSKVTTIAGLNARFPARTHDKGLATPKLAPGASLATMPNPFGQLDSAVESEFASSANLSASQITIVTLTVAETMASNAYLWPSGTITGYSPGTGAPLTSSTPVVLYVTP